MALGDFSTFCPAMYRNNQAAIAINRWIDPCFRLDQRTRNLSFRGPLFLVSQFISANRCRSFRTFFLLNIRLLTKSWRVNIVTSLFYLYPLGLSILRYFTQWDAVWQIGLQLLPGLLLLHFVLMQVYYFHPSARQVAWTVLATPFELISLILPKRFKKPFRTTTQSTRLKNVKKYR